MATQRQRDELMAESTARRFGYIFLPGAAKLVVALALAALFGWVASAKMGDPGQLTVYTESKPGAARPALTVAVATPGKPDPAHPVRTMPFTELDLFLKGNAQYQIQLVPGETCWPQPPSPEGTKTCVVAGAPVNGEQKIEVRESFGGDRDVHSVYTASSAGITPVSYFTVSGMEVMAAAFAIGIAGLFGLLLGLKLGELAAANVETRLSRQPIQANVPRNAGPQK